MRIRLLILIWCAVYVASAIAQDAEAGDAHESVSIATPPLDVATSRAIQSVMRRGHTHVQRCVDRIAVKIGDVSGKLTIAVAINTEGQVVDANALRDDIGHGLGECVSHHIQRWRFPALHAPVTLQQTYLFD